MENSTAAPPAPISYAAMLKRTSPGPAARPSLPPSPPLSPPSSPPSSLSPLARESIPSFSSPPTASPSPPPSPQPSPSSPGNDNTAAKEPHWAFPGRLAWLDFGKIGPSSIIRQRLRCQERVDGFEGHPVLIWGGPDEDGIVRIIPITSFGGQRAEQKWEKMREGLAKKEKLQQLLLLGNGEEEPHLGTETLLFERPIQLRKRSYLHIQQGAFKLEVDCLQPYTVGGESDIILAESAMRYIFEQLTRWVWSALWRR
ncbi:uncharacterized protein BKCO1_6900024 [Diplodia corticola]|uniref:Uncharacterized protein n=1 Tax=Diplodia corticola TaxID=236234 RepID=A0A1J9QM10_9PEZI|nr:uncharacterized protein BKCO1_6900024 [Diplodia corticola]OJD29942.1 hypothetical protein BKCO1_6900024 [Diplodia corticola]